MQTRSVARSSALLGQRLADDLTIQRIIGQRVASQRSVGIVVGVLDAGGHRRVVAYGDPGWAQPPLGPDSVFELGSIPKVFTATLLADMVQRAEVSLEDPVAQFLPATVSVPTRGDRQITLVDLATQTSGLPGCRPTCRPPTPPTRWPATPSSSCTGSCRALSCRAIPAPSMSTPTSALACWATP